MAKKKKREIIELTLPSASRFGWSKISAYMRCPRLYQNRYIKNIEGSAKLALMTGSAIHEGLAVFYSLKDRTDDNITYNVNRAILHYLFSLDDVEVETKMDVGCTALDTVYQYVGVQDNIIDSLGELTAEVALTLGDTGITARLDLICEGEDEVFFVDHKTSSVNSDSYFGKQSRAGYLVDGQFLLHHALGKEKYGDRYKGEILNIVTHTRKATFEMSQWFLPVPSDQEISEFLEMLVKLKDSIESNVESGYFPKVQHQLLCQSKYGACEFFDQCHPNKLETMDKVKEIISPPLPPTPQIEQKEKIEIEVDVKIPF